MTKPYENSDPPREDIDAIRDPLLLEFGSNYCSICSAAEPKVSAATAVHPTLRHLKIEDGRGRRLGRSFGVKLWPTLVFMKDGKEVSRLVRPSDTSAIEQALAGIAAA